MEQLMRQQLAAHEEMLQIQVRIMETQRLMCEVLASPMQDALGNLRDIAPAQMQVDSWLDTKVGLETEPQGDECRRATCHSLHSTSEQQEESGGGEAGEGDWSRPSWVDYGTGTKGTYWQVVQRFMMKPLQILWNRTAWGNLDILCTALSPQQLKDSLIDKYDQWSLVILLIATVSITHFFELPTPQTGIDLLLFELSFATGLINTMCIYLLMGVMLLVRLVHANNLHSWIFANMPLFHTTTRYFFFFSYGFGFTMLLHHAKIVLGEDLPKILDIKIGFTSRLVAIFWSIFIFAGGLLMMNTVVGVGVNTALFSGVITSYPIVTPADAATDHGEPKVWAATVQGLKLGARRMAEFFEEARSPAKEGHQENQPRRSERKRTLLRARRPAGSQANSLSL